MKNKGGKRLQNHPTGWCHGGFVQVFWYSLCFIYHLRDVNAKAFISPLLLLHFTVTVGHVFLTVLHFEQKSVFLNVNACHYWTNITICHIPCQRYCQSLFEEETSSLQLFVMTQPQSRTWVFFCRLFVSKMKSKNIWRLFKWRFLSHFGCMKNPLYILGPSPTLSRWSPEQ